MLILFLIVYCLFLSHKRDIFRLPLSLNNVYFRDTAVLKALQFFDINKSVGPDGILGSGVRIQFTTIKVLQGTAMENTWCLFFFFYNASKPYYSY